VIHKTKTEMNVHVVEALLKHGVFVWLHSFFHRRDEFDVLMRGCFVLKKQFHVERIRCVTTLWQFEVGFAIAFVAW
jgi:hypothetical protein